MNIRQAIEQDYPQIMQLLQLLNPDDPPLDGERGRAVLEQITQSNDMQLWVLEHDGALLGCVYLNIMPNLTRNARPYAVIENVITDAAHRYEGVGKKLVAQALESARQAGCYKVMLLTGRDEGVQQFYNNCGFSQKGKQAFIYRF